MKGHPIPYSANELAWLQANATLTIGEYHRGFVNRFGRPEVTASNVNALRKRKGWQTGRTGRFAPGQAPMNKGQKCAPGKGGNHPNARRSQFRKGREPHNTRWLGHERMSKDGYVEISVAETNPHTGYSRRYVQKHRWLWEQANGPVPKGHALKCLDGDRTNTAPSNWEAVPRGVLARLNGGRHKTTLPYDQAADEVKPAVMLAAKIKYRIHERRRGHE